MQNHPLLQFVFGGFYSFRKYLLDNVVYYSFILCGISDVSFDEIVARSYHNDNDTKKLDIDSHWDLDPILKIAEAEYNSSKSRYDLLKDKCKEIRLFCVLMISVSGILLPKVHSAMSLTPLVLVPLIAAMFFLFLSVLVLLVFWDTMVWSVVNLNQDQGLLKHQGKELKIHLIQQYSRAAVANDLRINYLVDIVRIARFYFMLAFTLLLMFALFCAF